MTDIKKLKKAIFEDIPECSFSPEDGEVYRLAFLQELIKYTNKFIPPHVLNRLFAAHLAGTSEHLDLSYFKD